MPDITQRFRLIALRVFLGATALGWGICIAGVVADSDVAFGFLELLAEVDSGPFQSDPMFDYWLRMASGVFALIGLGYLGLAICPHRYQNVLPFAGAFMIIEGLVLLAHGLRLGLQPVPFLGDTTFCLAGGIGILMCMGAASPDKSRDSNHLDDRR